MDIKKVMEIVRISAGINRNEQLRATSRGWNCHKIHEATKKKRLEKIKMKELREGIYENE